MKGIMTRMLAGLGTRNRVVLELALLLEQVLTTVRTQNFGGFFLQKKVEKSGLFHSKKGLKTCIF